MILLLTPATKLLAAGFVVRRQEDREEVAFESPIRHHVEIREKTTGSWLTLGSGFVYYSNALNAARLVGRHTYCHTRVAPKMKG